MCDVDTDGTSFDIREWRKARKQHECCVAGCELPIRRGDRYHVTTYCYDGYVSRVKHCARCWMICEALWKAGAGAIDFELNCGESWQENYNPNPKHSVLKLPEPEHLAFLTADDAQKLVPEVKL